MYPPIARVLTLKDLVPSPIVGGQGVEETNHFFTRRVEDLCASFIQPSSTEHLCARSPVSSGDSGESKTQMVAPGGEETTGSVWKNGKVSLWTCLSWGRTVS